MRLPAAALAAVLPLTLAVMPAHAAGAQLSSASCAPATAAPTPVRDLEPATLRYAGTFAVSGRTMPATSTLVVSAHPAGGWAVAERATLPRGEATDSARLDARSLVPVERVIRQGPMRVALRFTRDSASGSSTTDAQSRPVAIALCGPLLGDGAGAFLVIGHLPLGAGYHATLRHLDLEGARESTRALVVLGLEAVRVPGGSFAAWKVQLADESGANPATIWIDRASLVPVRFVATQGRTSIMMELTTTLTKGN